MDTKEDEQVVRCPRCGGSDFSEVDAGPDSWDSDITYTNSRCNKCYLFLNGWTKRWEDPIQGEDWKPEERD